MLCRSLGDAAHGGAGEHWPRARSLPLGISRLGTPSAVTPPSPVGPPADPFKGTPADDWADGTAGIAAPKAAPIGGYTTAQVEFAYQTTRKLLAAAYLDKETLLGGQPSAYADLLTSQQRAWFLGGLDKNGVAKGGDTLSTRTAVMAFTPGSTHLIGSVIKVHGTMSAQTSVSDDQKELDVHVDYLFTYPVEPPHLPADWTRVVAQAKWTVSFGNWAGGATTFEPWVDNTGGDVAGVECATTDGYEYPDFPAAAAAAPQPSASPSGTPIDPYELGHVASFPCQATTGT